MSSDLPLRYTQNFLTNTAVVERLAAVPDWLPNRAVLEIGPGEGIITQALAERLGPDQQGRRVVAVEMDARLVEKLRAKFTAVPQVHIVQQNILHFDLSTLGDDYVVVANVPFNITSDLLAYLFQPGRGPAFAQLILQTDALQARTRGGQTGETLKSLLIKPWYDVTLARRLARRDFHPAPAVDTALFAFRRREKPLVAEAQYVLYQDFVAYVAGDRVGEGAWRRLFSKKQIGMMGRQTGLVLNRGLKSQSFTAVVEAFHSFVRYSQPKHGRVQGAMQQFRAIQGQTTRRNWRGGHRRRTRR